MKRKDVYAVIMAGGKGERFWPKSRESKPKQLLDLVGDSTMIEQTVERLTGLIPSENIIIITNQDYVKPMQDLVDIPKENIIGEPTRRDTAPCVALAAAIIKTQSKVENPIMILLPADHVIKNHKNLCQVLEDSANLAKTNGNIVTIGIKPTFPSTGYGYIQCGELISDKDDKTQIFKSLEFKEKPNEATAKQFLDDGNYKWNSGMFIWSLETIIQAFENYTPSLYNLVNELSNLPHNEFIEKLNILFPQQEKNSIDYAIMEKAKKIFVAESTFDWDDVGSWTALRNQIDADENNNVISAKTVSLDTKNCIIVGNKNHLVTTIGVEDLIIVQTDDATLICKADKAQNIKEIVKKLSNDKNLKEYL